MKKNNLYLDCLISGFKMFRFSADVLFDIVLSFVYKFKKLDGNIVIFNSTANKKYCHNSVFLFEKMLTDKRFDNKRIYFVINNKELMDELNARFSNHFIASNTISGKLLCLSAKTWITSTIESPVYGLSINKNRIVYHLGHGVPLKNIGLAEKNISILKRINRKLRLRLFTHVTCYSSFFEEFFKKVFDDESLSYLKLGQPRNDSLMEANSIKVSHPYAIKIKQSKKVILYSPTWRPYAIAKFFPFDDFSVSQLHEYLSHNGYLLCIREHPNYKADLPEGIYDSPDVIDLGGDVIKDINPCLRLFDVLITDYSSIYFDFLILNKPVIYVPYDIEKYINYVGFSMPYEDLTSGVLANSFNGLLEAISECDDIDMKKHSSLIKNLNLKSSGNNEEHLEKLNELLSLS